MAVAKFFIHHLKKTLRFATIFLYLHTKTKVCNHMEPQIGAKMKVSPDLTGLDCWVEGCVIKIQQNPFRGMVLAIRDNLNRIFFGEAKYFMKA